MGWTKTGNIKGDPGNAATVAVGTVTTGAAGSSATVTNAGTSAAAVFNFSIPKGDTGATGTTGATGATGSTHRRNAAKDTAHRPRANTPSGGRAAVWFIDSGRSQRTITASVRESGIDRR